MASTLLVGTLEIPIEDEFDRQTADIVREITALSMTLDCPIKGLFEEQVVRPKIECLEPSTLTDHLEEERQDEDVGVPEGNKSKFLQVSVSVTFPDDEKIEIVTDDQKHFWLPGPELHKEAILHEFERRLADLVLIANIASPGSIELVMS